MWPWEEEEISETEYTRALQGLNRFLKEVDIDQLYTLEDVSAVASLLGHDLRIIAMAKGTRVEVRSGFLAAGTNESIDDIAYLIRTWGTYLGTPSLRVKRESP